MSPRIKWITEEDASGMRYYINTREAAHERPHIHVSQGKGKRTNDLKVWLDTVSVAAVKGDFPGKDVVRALKLISAMREDFIADYEAAHGSKKR